MQLLGAISKKQNDLSLFPGKPFTITAIQVYAPTTNAKEAEIEWFYEDLQHLFTNAKKKDILFIMEDWNAKLGSQQARLALEYKIKQRLAKFCQANTLVIANTLFQHCKRWLYIWISPNSQYRNQIDYILCTQRWRSSVQTAKTRLGADCGSDHELLIAKFRLKLKKVGKTTRPFRYDLNQISWLYSRGGE